MNVDEMDSRILGILRREARASIASIAEEVGLSRPAVADRIRKLEESGVVRGYTAVVDPGSRGGAITAFISARAPKTLCESEERALRELADTPEIEELHNVAGEDCFLIKVRAADIAGVHRIVRWLGQPPLGFRTKTTIVLSTLFEKVGGVLVTPEVPRDEA